MVDKWRMGEGKDRRVFSLTLLIYVIKIQHLRFQNMSFKEERLWY